MGVLYQRQIFADGRFAVCIRFPMMCFPLVLLGIKEISIGITSLLVIRKSGAVTGAVWHGKVTTALLYIMIFVHLVWFNIPAAVSNMIIAICFAMMLLSWVLYGWHHMKCLIKKGNGEIRKRGKGDD